MGITVLTISTIGFGVVVMNDFTGIGIAYNYSVYPLVKGVKKGWIILFN